jgi:hypothetical protein
LVAAVCRRGSEPLRTRRRATPGLLVVLIRLAGRRRYCAAHGVGLPQSSCRTWGNLRRRSDSTGAHLQQRWDATERPSGPAFAAARTSAVGANPWLRLSDSGHGCVAAKAPASWLVWSQTSSAVGDIPATRDSGLDPRSAPFQPGRTGGGGRLHRPGPRRGERRSLMGDVNHVKVDACRARSPTSSPCPGIRS